MPERQRVFEAAQKELRVPLTGLRENRAGYIAFTEREEDIDRMVTGKASKVWEKLGLEIRIPMKARCLSSVICRKIYRYICM